MRTTLRALERTDWQDEPEWVDELDEDNEETAS